MTTNNVTINSANSTTLSTTALPTINWPQGTSPTYYTSTNYGTSGVAYTSNPVYFSNSSNSIVVSNNNCNIVSIDIDGKVVWADGVNINEASEAFAKSLKLGSEIAAGIRENTKRNIRDTLFEEIIQIAETEGLLSASQLTFMYKSAKIMDKLRGDKNIN